MTDGGMAATTYEYSAPYYNPTSVVEAYHSIPRFGHTSVISSLASFDNDEQVDYAVGLVFLASVVLCFFLFWAVALIVFACMGQEQVGFLAGRGFVQPMSKTYGPGDDLGASQYKRPRRVRITFIVCAVCVVVFSILLVTNGLSQVETMQATLMRSNADVRDLTVSGEEIAEQLELVGDAAAPIRDELVGRLRTGFCPGNPSLIEETGYDFDGMAREGIGYLNQLSDFVNNDVAQLRDVLRQINAATEDLSAGLSKYDVSDPAAMAYVIPMIVLTCILAFAVVMAWCQMTHPKVDCVWKWFFLPLFGIAIVFSWVCVGLFGLVTTANSDMCSGGDGDFPSPDGAILEVLRQQGYDNPNSVIFQSITYYTGGCRAPFPFIFLEEYLDELNLAMNSTDVLRNSVDSIGIEELESLCGAEFASLNSLLDDVAEKLVILSDSADLAFDLISCESINPIYVNTFHKAACEESASGLSWVFASLLVISICGMTMLTLRSAMFDAITFEGYGDVADLRLAAQDVNGDGSIGGSREYDLREGRSNSRSRSNPKQSSRRTSSDRWCDDRLGSRTMPSQSASNEQEDDAEQEEWEEESYVYPPIEKLDGRVTA